MRIVVGIIIAALLGWCAWWFLGAKAQDSAWESWFDERRQAGWVAETSDISVTGFPNRFDTTIKDIQLADPQSGWAWSAPFFQVLMLSYKPNHIIAAWPETQKISGPKGTTLINSKNMRGSVVFVPNTDLTLDRTRIELNGLGLLGNDWSASLDDVAFATRRMSPEEAPDFAHQIGLDAKDIRLSEPLKRGLDPTGVLPASIEQAHIDIVAAFDAPWDRHSLEERKPKLTALSVKDVSATWGNMDLIANGKVDVDAQGYPVGDINLKAKNWQAMVDLAVGSGLIGRDLGSTVKDGLGLIAMLSGNRETLDVPLTFAGGEIRLGPIPIGRAPKLIIE